MNWSSATILVKGDMEKLLPVKKMTYTVQRPGSFEANILYQNSMMMNHFLTTKEEDEIPILIGPSIPFQGGIDLEEVLRNFELQEDGPKLPNDVSNEEEEVVLDDFQVEKSTYMCTHDEEMFSFQFEDKVSLDHVIHEEETNPTCDEISKGLNDYSV